MARVHGNQETFDRFRRLAAALLDASVQDADASALALHELLTAVAGLDEAPGRDEHTALSGGRALSPVDAARCLLDVPRTRAYIAGLRAAIEDCRAQRPDRPVHVLYAGCGPFASLALPLTLVFGADVVRFTCIDVHDASTESLRRVVTALGLEPYMLGVHQADATALAVPASPPVDILLVEALQRALTHEPQVAITRHLLEQLAPGVRLVPQRVTLRACLADIPAELAAGGPVNRLELGTVFELTADTASHDPRPCVLSLPRAPKQGESLVITTTLAIYADHALGEYKSGLTYPEIVGNTPPLEAGTQLEVIYDTRIPGPAVAAG